MRKIILIIAFAILAGFSLLAKDYKVAIGQTPMSVTLVKLFEAIAEVSNNKFDTQLVPMARAVYMIEEKQVDMFFPSTMNPNLKNPSGANFDYSTVSIWRLCYIQIKISR